MYPFNEPYNIILQNERQNFECLFIKFFPKDCCLGLAFNRIHAFYKWHWMLKIHISIIYPTLCLVSLIFDRDSSLWNIYMWYNIRNVVAASYTNIANLVHGWMFLNLEDIFVSFIVMLCRMTHSIVPESLFIKGILNNDHSSVLGVFLLLGYTCTSTRPHPLCWCDIYFVFCLFFLHELGR